MEEHSLAIIAGMGKLSSLAEIISADAAHHMGLLKIHSHY